MCYRSVLLIFETPPRCVFLISFDARIKIYVRDFVFTADSLPKDLSIKLLNLFNCLQTITNFLSLLNCYILFTLIAVGLTQ